MEKLGTEAWQRLSGSESSVITIDESQVGRERLLIDQSRKELDGLDWTIRVTV